VNALSARRLRIISWTVFSMACLLFVFLNYVFYTNVGILWRDEISSVAVADMPTLSDTVANFATAGAPSLFPAILHFWIKIGMDASDDWLRLLPFLISLGVVAALVWRGVRSGGRPPLLALALLAFNPTVFYWGASVRPYGLTVIFIVVLFGSLQRMLQEPSIKNAASAAVAAVLAAQSSFQSSYLIAALCAATAIAGIAVKKKSCALFAVAAGAIAGLSLVPYALALSNGVNWVRTLQTPFEELSLWRTIEYSLGSAGIAMIHVWIMLITGALIVPPLLLLSGWKTEKGRDRFATSLYAATAIPLSVLGMILFLWMVGISPSPWRTIPLMALLAMAVDAALGAAGDGRRALIGVMGTACLVISLCLPTMWFWAHVHFTNIDTIAAHLMRDERPGDFAVIMLPFCGISFDRYYDGRTPWMTMPPIPHEDLAQYDKVMRHYMNSPQETLDPLIDKITETLQSGGRVWMIGGMPTMLTDGERAHDLIPAPHPVYGWNIDGYLYDWQENLGALLRAHVLQVTPIDIPQEQGVMPHEKLPLELIEGWQQ